MEDFNAKTLLDLNEKEILKKLSEGNSIAFGQVVNLYHDRLLHFSFHYLNDKELAKDVIQDVFSNLWENHKKLSEVKNLSSWLFTLTKNQCLKKIDYLKVRQKYADVLAKRQLEVAYGALTVLDTSPMIFDEINNIVSETLNKLSPQTKQIFELSRFESKKNKEIAAELNISIKTVESNITKALKIFRKELRPFLPILMFLLKN